MKPQSTNRTLRETFIGDDIGGLLRGPGTLWAFFALKWGV